MASTEQLPRKRRLTVQDYDRMSQTGILPPDAHVELIDGEIIDMAPSGSRHAGTVMQLTHVLTAAVRGCRAAALEPLEQRDRARRVRTGSATSRAWPISPSIRGSSNCRCSRYWDFRWPAECERLAA